MLRHGATEANQRHVFAGQTDLPITPEGAAQLRALWPTAPVAETFFISGMLRTAQTLQVLYGDVPHVVIPALREYAFGVFEGRGHQTLYADEPIYRQWLDASALDVACPGGETRRQFADRVLSGFASLCAQSGSGLAVLIAHGGVLCTLMDHLAPLDAPHMTPPNGAGWRLVLSPEGAVTRHKPVGWDAPAMPHRYETGADGCVHR